MEEDSRMTMDSASVVGSEYVSPNGLQPRAIADEATRASILRDLVQPSLIEEIKNTMKHRKYWARASNVCDILGKVFIVMGTILAFLAFYSKEEPKREYSFVSGVSGILALTLMYFEARAENASKEITAHLNSTFKSIGIISHEMHHLSNDQSDV